MSAVHVHEAGEKAGIWPRAMAILAQTESNSALWAQRSCPASLSTGRSEGLPTHWKDGDQSETRVTLNRGSFTYRSRPIRATE